MNYEVTYIICSKVKSLYTLVSHSSAILVPKLNVIISVHHLVQTAHDNSLVVPYGGQGSDPHRPSTK